ncbi:hypothetical protein [Roseomonas sp. 18066]|uniref:hypothetical protein n=1 Tax=Roseomonas sp. 18066 TaxID=2681412 RepID=UPI001359E8C6|nr:hypothetical protein [Roseomonas sp. 18066]
MSITLPPATLPAEVLDRMLHALAAQRTSGLIHLFLGWPAAAPPPDAARLARAARLLVDAEPVLACRLLPEGRDGLRWHRHPDIDAIPWFEAIEASDRDAAIRQVIGAEEPAEGRNLILRLARLGDGGWLLALSVNHVVADGAAVYDCAYRLAALHDALAADPAHHPAPNLSSRDSYEWMANFSGRHWLRVLRRDLGELRQAGTRTLGLSGPADLAGWLAAPRDAPAYAAVTIEPARLAALDRQAVALGASRLELLVAALARSFHAMLDAQGPAAFRVILPGNLRRYAGASRQPAIRNMSGMAAMTFTVDPATPFATTLAAARAEGARLKRGLAGATNPLAVGVMRRLGRRRLDAMLQGVVARGLARPSPPTFTNVGRLAEPRLRFGGVLPQDAMLLTMAFPRPLLLITGTEFRRALTLAIGFQAEGWSSARMQPLLDRMLAELPA